MHSFHAYIDEAGDEGFKFGETRDTGSSDWFIVSACVVRSTRLSNASRKLLSILQPIEEKRQSPVHFHKLPHDAKVALIECIASLPIRIICICVDKRTLPAGHTLGSDRRMYFYATRLLLERISWIARDQKKANEGDGRCKLHFSHCKGLSYARLGEYLQVVKGTHNQIAWPNLDTVNFNVLGHADNIWLRAADAIASGVGQGLELSRHGFTEERFVRSLKKVVYHNGINYLSYGMKFMPVTPTPKKDKANRYSWLALYKG